MLNLVENSFFTAGAGLALLGVGATALKMGCTAASSLAYKRLLCSLEVNSRDPAYQWLLRFLGDMRIANSSKLLAPPDKIALNTTFQKRENGSSFHKFDINPGIGNYFLKYKNRYIKVERSREGKLIDLKNGAPFETLSLTTLSIDRKIFNTLLEEAREHAIQKDEGKLVIYTSWGVDWKQFGNPRRKRDINSVILDSGVSELIQNDISNFLKDSFWYHKRGIPYRRGYLLYGPPGTGKTSFIQALAGSIDYNICLLNLSDRGMTDDRLAHLLNHVPPRCFILLEDIDSAFPSRLDKNPAQPQFAPLLTLSGLLNALDGVQSGEERIIFMTTNHVERLDPALIRPGRVDLKQLIDVVSDDQILKLYSRFYSVNADEQLNGKFSELFLDECRRLSGGKAVSAAQLQGHFVFYKNDPDAAFKNVSKLFQIHKKY